MEIKKLDTKNLSEFYQSSQAIYQLAPWNNCSDSDLFGVLIPETNELHFVSVMGGAGLSFGIATYRGISGLDLFLAILDGLFDVDPTLVQRRQDGLFLEFVEKENLEESDLNMAKQASFQPSDEKSWVFMREFSRGWSPWEPTDKDLIAMKVIFSALQKFSELQNQDPTWSTKNDRVAFPIFMRTTGSDQWNVEWWNDEKIVKTTESFETSSTNTINELILNEAKALQKDSNVTWEAYSFYAPNPETKEARPFFPEVCVIIDRNSERCLAMEIIQPTQNRSLILRDLALKAILAEKILPTGIVIEETDLLKELLYLKKVLGVDFKINGATVGRKFEAGMFENAKVRTFS